MGSESWKDQQLERAEKRRRRVVALARELEALTGRDVFEGPLPKNAARQVGPDHIEDASRRKEELLDEINVRSGYHPEREALPKTYLHSWTSYPSEALEEGAIIAETPAGPALVQPTGVYHRPEGEEPPEELEEEDPGPRTQADSVFPLHGHAGHAVAFARVATDLLARSQELKPPDAGRVGALGRTFEAAAREKLTMSKHGPGQTPEVTARTDRMASAIRSGARLFDLVEPSDVRTLAEEVRASRDRFERPFGLAALLAHTADLVAIRNGRYAPDHGETADFLEELRERVEDMGGGQVEELEEEGKE